MTLSEINGATSERVPEHVQRKMMRAPDLGYPPLPNNTAELERGSSMGAFFLPGVGTLLLQ